MRLETAAKLIDLHGLRSADLPVRLDSRSFELRPKRYRGWKEAEFQFQQAIGFGYAVIDKTDLSLAAAEC